MNNSQIGPLSDLVDEISSIEINLNHYYEDVEPQHYYDQMISGKIDALYCYCDALGWDKLAHQIKEILPLEGTAPAAMERVKGYVIPEVRRRIQVAALDVLPSASEWFWDLIHPRITSVARPRIVAGFNGDAVESAFKEVNDTVKRIFRESEGQEFDGANLMNRAFSVDRPIIQLDNLNNETGRNIQKGYLQIFAGSMTGIRNPKAHGNLNPDARKALHLIALASLLMHKIDERV